MKARGDIATMIGWNAEAFARTKKMESLGHYLEPAKPMTTQEQRDAESRALMRMFDKAIAKQNAVEKGG